MRNTYTVTYRCYNGRIKAEELSADTYFDAAALVRLSHRLEFADIISNVIKDVAKAQKPGKRKYQHDR